LELRASISLAKLWRQQQRIEEARDLIEPIYRWFKEGAATSDLTRARDLLTALH
jgi:predicted ATPase